MYREEPGTVPGHEKHLRHPHRAAAQGTGAQAESVLSKIEGQHRAINDYELLAIANTLDISIDDLLGRNE